jgi:hypothetical protein
MSRLFLDMPVTADTLVVGISLPARWSHAINRAAEILRQRHPKADDDEIMRMMLIHGMVDVIDGANACVLREDRNKDDDNLIAIAEAVL